MQKLVPVRFGELPGPSNLTSLSESYLSPISISYATLMCITGAIYSVRLQEIDDTVVYACKLRELINEDMVDLCPR